MLLVNGALSSCWPPLPEIASLPLLGCSYYSSTVLIPYTCCKNWCKTLLAWVFFPVLWRVYLWKFFLGATPQTSFSSAAPTPLPDNFAARQLPLLGSIEIYQKSLWNIFLASKSDHLLQRTSWTMLGNSWNTLGILLQDLNSHPALGIMA